MSPSAIEPVLRACAWQTPSRHHARLPFRSRGDERILPRSLHLPVAPTDDSATENLDRTGLRCRPNHSNADRLRGHVCHLGSWLSQPIRTVRGTSAWRS